MRKLTIGKVRGLQQIATSKGVFVMCAMDHRSGLVSMLEETQHEKPDYPAIVALKLEMCRTLGPYSSGILLDPEYGAAQCIASGVLAGSAGLLVSIEATGYEKDPKGRLTALLKDWSVEKIKRMGASAVKILVYYRPDMTEIAQKQLSILSFVAEECIKYDIPFLVEPKTYRSENEKMGSAEFAQRLPEMVIETARQITDLPVDVLKAEFPADVKYEKDPDHLSEYCRQLDKAAQVPWVILSAGVDYDTFKLQVKLACKAGASGFLGGRAIWQEALNTRDQASRNRYFQEVAAGRMQELGNIAQEHGRSWYDKLGLHAGDLTDVREDWYKRY